MKKSFVNRVLVAFFFGGMIVLGACSSNKGNGTLVSAGMGMSDEPMYVEANGFIGGNRTVHIPSSVCNGGPVLVLMTDNKYHPDPATIQLLETITGGKKAYLDKAGFFCAVRFDTFETQHDIVIPNTVEVEYVIIADGHCPRIGDSGNVLDEASPWMKRYLINDDPS